MVKGKKYYGVAKGRTVGVFRKLFAFPIFQTDDDRPAFEKATKGYPGALWEVFETQEEAAQYIKQCQRTEATSTVAPTASDASTAIAKTPSGASPVKRTKKKLAATQTLAIKGQSEPEDKTMAEPIEEMQDEPIKKSLSRQKSVQFKPCSEPPFGVFIDRNSQSLCTPDLACRSRGSTASPPRRPRVIRSHLLSEFCVNRI
jgi:hypothetical protein